MQQTFDAYRFVIGIVALHKVGGAFFLAEKVV
jgi:hypothetical protein